ncbi:GNAT family N-acetyltransferase [Neisseria chenwenguii]|uniref:GNAT family N-acetyltransferase n=1 Tax=Neisseria chenwenguii TaxID=1853278 RepID=UPI0018DEFEAB|nr:GNAT family protein [Neisseria chenwenguii]
MIQKPIAPVTLRLNGIRLEPLTGAHETGLGEAASDGQLWDTCYTAIPRPEEAADYIRLALETPDRTAFAVIDEASGKVIGSTSYYNVLLPERRFEIGYTWYGQSHWRTAVNTTCKYLLLCHAFDTLGFQTAGWCTDILNKRSQRAIERLGAKKDGVIRGDRLRGDGSVRDSVVYSMIRSEWPQAKAALESKLGLA